MKIHDIPLDKVIENIVDQISAVYLRASLFRAVFQFSRHIRRRPHKASLHVRRPIWNALLPFHDGALLYIRLAGIASPYSGKGIVRCLFGDQGEL